MELCTNENIFTYAQTYFTNGICKVLEEIDTAERADRDILSDFSFPIKKDLQKCLNGVSGINRIMESLLKDVNLLRVKSVKLMTESELALKDMEKWEKRVKETAEYDQVMIMMMMFI
jgi:hypothetical protein